MASTQQDHDELVAADDAVIGHAFRWSVVVIAVLVIVVGAGVWAFRRPDAVAPPQVLDVVPPETVDHDATAPKVTFTDITEASGIDFVHENGATGDKLLPETMGSGAAFFDYDNDGDQDLLLVNGTHWPEREATEPLPTMKLYRNDGTGKFDDVTAAVGLDVSFYGTGVAVGDYDNDGSVDLFVSAVGHNHLFHNESGRFVDVTAAADVAGEANEWSTSAGFVDYDNDGDLDLVVCNYVRWSRAIDFEVDYRLVGLGRAYGPPMNFEGTFLYLYRNDGGGKFSDVTEASGLHVQNPATGQPMGKALGLAPFDFDRDGWIDLFIANDTVANFLFRNRGDGTFEEVGAAYGLAYDSNGSATGAMGVDVGHYRNDDEVGVAIGNFANEMTSLFVSQGEPTLFTDEAIVEGVGAPTRLMLSFGLFLFDYDLDGRLDLFQTNGHLEEEINLVQPSQHYQQPAQLMWNRGSDAGGHFLAVGSETTGDLGVPMVGRGTAYADIDGDGDLDLVVTQPGRRAMLLRNDQSLQNNVLRVKLVGSSCNRDAIGARLTLTAGGVVQRRVVMPTRSYLSQVELPVTFGLGRAPRIESLEIHWPGGGHSVFEPLEPNAVLRIDQEAGVSILARLRG